MTTRYELLYIIPSTLTDDEVGGVETKVAAVLTKFGAQIESTKRLGKFRFAYPIDRQRHGHYVLVLFVSEASALAKIEENLRITADVLRHLVLRADEAGQDEKYELVQFTEINVDLKDDRAPRRREKAPEDAPKEETKVGVENKGSEVVLKEEISSEELEKKIETALSEDAKEV